VTALLEVRDLTVRFGGVHALENVGFEVAERGVLGLVGPNGSGKTTLVNVISGFVRPAAGSLTFDDRQLQRLRPDEIFRAGIARTFQSIRLLPTLSVRQNLLLGAEHTSALAGRGRPWSRARRRLTEQRVDEALERLQLQRSAYALPEGLAYGIQRRVEIARTMLSRPRLIMLDEPFAGMSRTERDDLVDTLLSVASDGFAFLVIEHDLRVLQRLCDRLLVLNFGRCIAQGAPRETASLPEVQEAYLGRKHVAS
jgi:branched-chain amino acid transport system ATP-binding protein